MALKPGQLVLLGAVGYGLYRLTSKPAGTPLTGRVPTSSGGYSPTGPYAGGYRFPTTSPTGQTGIPGAITGLADLIKKLIPDAQRPPASGAGAGSGGGGYPGNPSSGQGGAPSGRGAGWGDPSDAAGVGTFIGPIDQTIEGAGVDWSTYGTLWWYGADGGIVYSQGDVTVPDVGPSGAVGDALGGTIYDNGYTFGGTDTGAGPIVDPGASVDWNTYGDSWGYDANGDLVPYGGGSDLASEGAGYDDWNV